jgi:hypothetical protein
MFVFSPNERAFYAETIGIFDRLGIQGWWNKKIKSYQREWRKKFCSLCSS